MKTLLAIIIVTILLLVPVMMNNNVKALCMLTSDWPNAPCYGDPASIPSKEKQREDWTPYYQYKGASWMETMKTQMINAMKNGTLEDWVTGNQSNYDVWRYYYVNDQAPFFRSSVSGLNDEHPYFPPPLQQLTTGIAPKDVSCKETLELVIKTEDGSPACVRYTTAALLIERGWAKEAILNMKSSESTITIPVNSSILYNGFTFTPSVVKVIIGTNNTVRWINMDSVTNDIISEAGSFRSGPIYSGYSWTHIFDKPGTYPYHSSIHPWLKGTINVISSPIITNTTTQNTNCVYPCTTIQVAEPSVIKIKSVGISPYPLKVGDMAKFNVTYQKIGDGQLYHIIGCGSDLSATFSPSSSIREMYDGRMCAEGIEAIKQNQTITEGTWSSSHILKPGLLNVTLNLYLSKEGIAMYEGKPEAKIQFFVNVSQPNATAILENNTGIVTLGDRTYYFETPNYTDAAYTNPVKVSFHDVVFTLFPNGFRGGLPLGGCGGQYYWTNATFSDGTSELLHIFAGFNCISPMPSTQFSNHTNPQAGLTFYDGKMKLLVSTDQNQTTLQNSSSTSFNEPESKLGPDLLGPIPHQLVFFMNSSSTAKIFAEYKSSLDNTGTLPSYSRVYVGNTTYLPLATSDVTISANPSSIPLAKGSDTIVVYSVTAKQGVKGVYWIFLVQFCRVMPLAVGIDSLTISPSEIPVHTGTMYCPAQYLDANILGISGGKAEYKIGVPVQ